MPKQNNKPKPNIINKCKKCGKAIINGKPTNSNYKKPEEIQNIALVKDTQERELAPKIIEFIMKIRQKEANLLNDDRILRALQTAAVLWEEGP